MTITHDVESLGVGKQLGTYPSGSAEWHAAREHSIGGSDVGAICGVNPYSSPWRTWAIHTGRLGVIEATDRMRLGQLLESGILQMFAEKNPKFKVQADAGTWENILEPWQHANPDGFYIDSTGQMGIVEIKFSGYSWDGVPPMYRAQVMWYMHVTGIRQATIAAVAGGNYSEYHIRYDELEVDAMLDRVRFFWNECITENKEPLFDGAKDTYEVIRALAPGIYDGESELGPLGSDLIVGIADLEAAESKLTETKSRIMKHLDGIKTGLHYGEPLVRLQSSSTGKPFIKILRNS